MINSTFTDLKELDPSFVIYLPYATEENFMKRRVYPAGSRAFLRKPVALGLGAAQRELKKKGLGLKIWDAYRPFSVQEVLWNVCPDDRYVARPVRNGEVLVKGSVHNRGAAVDLTLIEIASGTELAMPTGFDEFSERAHRSFREASPSVLNNRALLESTLEKFGFIGLPTEWWHFDWAQAESFPLSDEPIEALRGSPTV